MTAVPEIHVHIATTLYGHRMNAAMSKHIVANASEHDDSGSEEDTSGETSEISLSLANWEQWGLSMEEYHHSMQLFESNPNGKPLGHI